MTEPPYVAEDADEVRAGFVGGLVTGLVVSLVSIGVAELLRPYGLRLLAVFGFSGFGGLMLRERPFSRFQHGLIAAWVGLLVTILLGAALILGARAFGYDL